MRPAGTFATLLAVGVLIVLIYQWSGDSIIVLIMCLITLFALLALWDRKPWAVDPDSEGRTENRKGGRNDQSVGDAPDSRPQNAPSENPKTEGGQSNNPTESPADQDVWMKPAPESKVVTKDAPVWRCRFDIQLTAEGVTGLALGEREPRLWLWEAIATARIDWSQAIAEGDSVEERVALHLRLRDIDEQDPVVQETAQLMFGAAQHPNAVAAAITKGVRMMRIQRSRFNSLSPAERTRQLTDALSPQPVNLTKSVRSPELLYQEARRVLLTNRALRRVSRDANAEQVLVAFEQLLAAHQAAELDEAEIGPLGSAADGGDLESVYLFGSQIVEARGYRLAFVHHGGEDHLFGLLAFDDAEDWDGQTIGSGLTTISLTPPTYD